MLQSGDVHITSSMRNESKNTNEIVGILKFNSKQEVHEAITMMQ